MTLMMTRDDSTTKIDARAQCICEICQQMGWKECQTQAKDPDCGQLISKFVDHDSPHMVKTHHFDDGTKVWYVKIAGVKTPSSVVHGEISRIVDRMDKLKIHSRHMLREIHYPGRLEREGDLLLMNVLKSVGLNSRDMSPVAMIYARVLEKFVAQRVRKQLAWYSDMDIETWEDIIRRHGVEAVRKKMNCPYPDLLAGDQ